MIGGVALPGGGTLAAEPGMTYELDRRSHPAVTKGWDAVLRGAWDDPVLAELPALKGAQILHGDDGWVLLRLSASAGRSPPRGWGPTERSPPEAIGGRCASSRKRNRNRPPALTVLQSLAASVNIDQMMTGLNAIASTIQTRYYNTTGMQNATQYVLDKFNAYGLSSAYFDSFTYSGASVRNVVGVKTGTVYPNRIYMICGHLDSTSPQSGTLAPGAEDNGSGAIGVLEAARLMAPMTFQSTIYFVCFTAEEQGMIGSEHLAAIADAQNWDLRGVLAMDMIGYDTAGSPDIWIEGWPGNPSSVALMDALQNVATTYTDMGVYRYPSNGYGSDHVPFNSHGFPALLAIDNDWESYSCYHKTCDTVSNIVQNQFRRMALSVIVTTAQLAVPTNGLGSVNGTADKTDSTDDSGVQIQVKNTTYASATSGTGGAFTLSDLLPGTYTLRATAAGYEAAEASVTILAGQAASVSIPLNPVAPSRVSGVVSPAGGWKPGRRAGLRREPGRLLPGRRDGRLSPRSRGSRTGGCQRELRRIHARRHDGDRAGGRGADRRELHPETRLGFRDFLGESGIERGLGVGRRLPGRSPLGNEDHGERESTPATPTAPTTVSTCRPSTSGIYESARLHFWHWYKTESGYDGGNVQVSTDAGATWTVLAPVGGYSSTMTGTCNPLAGQQGFVGTKTTWTESIVDLASYVGSSIRVRFRFGSDSGVTDRGWYIDDISLEGTLTPTGIAEDPDSPAALLSQLSVVPNPAYSTAQIRFALGLRGDTWVTVFDASGRRVRNLLESAGAARRIPFGRVEWPRRCRAIGSGGHLLGEGFHER